MSEEIKNNVEGSQNEVKTYTEEEVAALVQSEADKRVTQALKTQQEKFEKKMSEAEKLRNMDESQQEKYKLEQRIAELEEANRAFSLAENKATLAKALADRNLPVQFVDYLVGEDAEVMMSNVNEFEKSWKAAIADAVSAKLSTSGGVAKGGTVKQTGITKEEFQKMTLAQQSELYQTNKQLYLELSKR